MKADVRESRNSAYIGIDLGGTNLRFALIDGDGTILSRLRYPTDSHLGRRPLVERLVSGIHLLAEESLALGVGVAAIGVGVPGLISAEGFIHSSVNLPFLEGEYIRDTLAVATGLPVVVANDANAIAYGEKTFGVGRPFRSFIMLTIGTGIGSGLILDDRLWTGRDGVAAEYGHATVEPDGILCACGNHGCLEQYASASAIIKAAVREVAAGRSTALGGVPPHEITAAQVALAAADGDLVAGEILSRAGYYLGIASATILNLLNLEAIIIGGGVAASLPLLLDPLLKEISRRAFSVTADRVQVIAGELGDDAGLLGSAALAAAACGRA